MCIRDSVNIFLLHFPNDRGKLPGISDGADVFVDQRPRLDKNKTTHHRDRIESMISHKRVEYIYESWSEHLRWRQQPMRGGNQSVPNKVNKFASWSDTRTGIQRVVLQCCPHAPTTVGDK